MGNLSTASIRIHKVVEKLISLRVKLILCSFTLNYANDVNFTPPNHNTISQPPSLFFKSWRALQHFHSNLMSRESIFLESEFRLLSIGMLAFQFERKMTSNIQESRKARKVFSIFNTSSHLTFFSP